MHKRRIAGIAAALAAAGIAVVPISGASASTGGTSFPAPTARSGSYNWSAIAQAQAAARQWRVVADRQNNPRGITISPLGNVYDAQAGAGGKTCLRGTCVGFTGAVTRVKDGVALPVLSGLISAAGRDGTFATGADDVAISRNGSICVIETSAGLPNPPGLPPGAGRQLGKLLCYTSSGGLQPVADLAAYEFRHDPDGQGKDSDPYAVLALPDGSFAVADAAGNDVLRVQTDGTISVLAVLPNNSVGAQSVPTSLALGPDGAIYVGELGGEEHGGTPAGGARVWRIDSRTHALTQYKTGFTHISGLDFGPDGSLYVTELTRDPSFQNPLGDVVRVWPNGSRTRLGTALVFPAGVAVGSAGNVFVNNASVLPAYTAPSAPFFGLRGQLVELK